MKKSFQYIFIIFFIGLSLIPLGAWIMDFDTPMLAPGVRIAFPTVLTGDRINTMWTQQFDNYWDHQYPTNSAMVSINNRLFESFFATSGSDRVIVGQDGFLFFQETEKDILKTSPLSEMELSRLEQVVLLQKEFTENKGSRYFLTVAPNKASIYPEKLPYNMKPLGIHSTLESLISRSNLPLINLTDILLNMKTTDGRLIYHREDSHWNNLGASIVYKKLFREMGLKPLELNDDYSLVKNWQGDLRLMLQPAWKRYEWQYEHISFEPEFTLIRPMRTLEDIEIRTRNKSQSGRLLMYRDSFANALIPLISSSTEEAVYLRRSENDLREVEKFSPDLVLFQIVERNINWILQRTPIMPAPKRTLPKIVGSVSTAIDAEIDERFGMIHYNIRLNDHLNYERVIVSSGNSYYEAFPIYQDNDIEDDNWEEGFSWYSEQPMEELSFYLLIENNWYLLK